jgi:pimeloyl-ACP methyl ester carboxylesterase
MHLTSKNEIATHNIDNNKNYYYCLTNMSGPSPDMVIDYPICGDDTGGTLFLFSDHHLHDGSNNESSSSSPDISCFSHVILFCAGYPDDHTVFLPFAARLAKEIKNVLCGVTCLAGYDNFPPNKPWTNYAKTEGYSMDQWATSLRAAAKALNKYAVASSASSSDTTKSTFTTIFHDWGVIPGTIYVNRALADETKGDNSNDSLGDMVSRTAPDQVILFDVCPPFCHRQQSPRPKRERPSFLHVVRENLYRVCLALGFVLYRFVSKYVALVVVTVLSKISIPLGLGPFAYGSADSAMGMEKFLQDWDRGLYMTFPYYSIFQMIANGTIQQLLSEFHLPLLDQVPLLYLYGIDKNVQFHDANLVAFIKEYGASTQTKTTTVEVADAGHWLYMQQEDVCIQAVQKFLLAPK